jgi:CheY-like chemotaxis protein
MCGAAAWKNCGAAAVVDSVGAHAEVRGEECHGMDVLVVEKDAPLRTVLTTWLRERGLEVGEAASGEAALEIAEISARPPVVVTNTRLGTGRMTGLAVGEVLRRRWPDMGVIYITGHADPPRDGSGARERCLPTPFPLAALLDTIREVAPSGRTEDHGAGGM